MLRNREAFVHYTNDGKLSIEVPSSPSTGVKSGESSPQPHRADNEEVLCDDRESCATEESGLFAIAEPLALHEGSNDTFQPISSHNRDLLYRGSRLASIISSAGSGKIASPHSYLCNVPHLCTLPLEQLSELNIMVREYGLQDVIIDAGQSVSHVFVVVGGTVEVFNTKGSSGTLGHRRVGHITAPNIFGMDNIVLQQPSEFSFRAGAHKTTSHKTRLLLINKAEFLLLLQNNSTFAHSVAHKLVDHMKSFTIFQEYCRAIFSVSSAVVDGKLTSSDDYTLGIGPILDSYAKLESVIHPHQSSTEIDVTSWAYASRRLPENIADTYVLTLARSLPPFIASELRASSLQQSDNMAEQKNLSVSFAMDQPVDVVSFVPTKDRRRCSWKVGDKGNTLVLLREGFTDVLDFVTCFCIHFVEARKVRRRLEGMVRPSAVEILREGMKSLRKNQHDPVEKKNICRRILTELPLSPKEADALSNLWPQSSIRKLYSVLMHREEFLLKIDHSMSKRFDLDPNLQWVLSLRTNMLKLLGLADNLDTVPPEVTIDILSSNTYSTKNLLCCTARNHHDDILQWGKRNQPDISSQAWFNEDDKLYYLNSQLMDHEARIEYSKELQRCGFVVQEDTSMTGLQVDIIDCSKLDANLIDPLLRKAFLSKQELVNNSGKKETRRRFILNMDFAFGAQADGITRALILTFGHHIRSLNVVGKAGGLVGTRGDVLLPNYLIFAKACLGEDSTDEIRSTGNHDIQANRLRELLGSGPKLYEGPLITIPGTVLQNRATLNYYQSIFGCIGLEMEGSYFARQIEESINLNLIKSDVVTRFAYYVDDLPLESESRRAPLKAIEGVPPMYAIVRAMMEQMFF